MQSDLEMVALGLIDTDGANPNGRVRGVAFDELKQSVARNGVLQPVLVRAASKDGRGVILIAGHRRLAAARELGHETIPCLVISSDVDEDAELRLVENLHREGMAPLDEAAAFSQLAVAFGADGAEEIAARIGKPARYVRRRLALLTLPAPAREALEAGTLSVRAAEIISTVGDKKARDRIVKAALHQGWGDGIHVASAHEVRHIVLRECGHLLADAPWKPGDATLEVAAGAPCVGACLSCPFNSGTQEDLFGEHPSARAECLSPEGWAAKSRAYAARRALEVREAGGRELTGAEVKALQKAGANGSASGGGLVRLDQHCAADPRYRTYRELIGKAAAPILVGVVDGAVVEAIAPAEALALARAHGVKIDPRKSSESGSPQENAAARRERDKAAAERGLVVQAFEKLDAALEGGRALDMPWVLATVITGAHHAQQMAVLSRRGWSPEKKGGGSPRELLLERAKGLTVKQALGLLVEVLAVPSYPGDTKALEAACGAHGVRWAALEKKAEAALAEKRATRASRKAKARTAAKPKAAARVRRKSILKDGTKGRRAARVKGGR